MTIVHFFTCATLCFAPIYVIYKSTRMANSNNYSNLIYGFITYSIALFAKMLLIATFIPNLESNYSVVPDVTIIPQSGWSRSFAVYEVVKAMLNLFDFFVLYLLFNRVKLFGGDDSKVIGVGLGFSLAENVLSRAIPLYVGTTHGMEFEWTWVRVAVHANISMFLYIAFAASVYLFTRLEKHSVDRPKMTFAGLLSVVLLLLPILSQVVNHFISLILFAESSDKYSLNKITRDDPTTALLVHTVFTIVIGTVAYRTFKNHFAKKQK